MRLFIDSCLTLVVLLDLSMLASSRLSNCIRIFGAQSFLLALLPMAVQYQQSSMVGAHAVAITAGTIGLKVVLVPWILLRVLRTGEIHKEVEPYLGFTTSVLSGALIVITSFALAHRTPVPVVPATDLILPVAISTVSIGLLVLVGRLKAITQVIGYLVLENGIFIFGLLLLEQMPVLVELAILLDLFVAVFIMGIVMYHIRREFDHIDTHFLDQPREA